MLPSGGHTEIKSQIVAFLFNTRADVLRDEMYKALCLHVLHESGMPSSIDQIVELVAYAVGPKVEITKGLKTIVLDEIKNLESDGLVRCDDGLYSLEEGSGLALPNKQEEETLNNTIFNEIKKIAVSIRENITKKQINQLFEFYLFVCNLIAREKMLHVANSEEISVNYIDTEKLNTQVAQARNEYQVDQIIEGEKFIDRCFRKPNDILSRYEFVLIQVNVIFQLLTWDPALEYIQDKVLKGKTLILDSSILFSLMIEASETHEFITNLIATSKKELGVNIIVHENTIKEYEGVLRNYGIEFNEEQQHLRQLAAIAKKDGIPPQDILGENKIFTDYLTKHADHIDLGSWQRYTNDVGVDALKKKIVSMGAMIDKRNMAVPYESFKSLKENMIRASVEQMRRGRRSGIKSDVTHDVQIFSLIKKTRKKSSGEYSFGYDTYLLTLDGSLPYFTKFEGITWTETYFIFPYQWYELSFPFLRMKISEHQNITKTFSTMAFSGLFAKLESLIPLHVFGYVFDNGGQDLSLRSVQSIIDALFEQRLSERLNPANKNIKEREQAKLSLQRIIAEKLIEEKKIIIELQEKEKQIDNRIAEKQTELSGLEEEAVYKEAELVATDKKLLEKTSVLDIYSTSEELRDRLETEKKAAVEAVQLKYSSDLEKASKEKSDLKLLTLQQEERIKKMENDISALSEAHIKSQIEKDDEKRLKQIQVENTKKAIVTTLMVFGVLLNILLLPQFGVGVIMMLVSTCLMIFGIAFFHWLKNSWWSFIVFGVGLLVASGAIFIKYQFETLLWIIPMAWEVLVLGIDRIYKK